MFPLATKKAMATALAGAAIATSFGPSAAPAASGGIASAACPAPPPSLMATSAAQAYEQMRAECATLASTTAPVTDGASVPDAFDVPSAAIGAAAGTGVLILLLAAGGVVRRGSQTRGRGPAGA